LRGRGKTRFGEYSQSRKCKAACQGKSRALQPAGNLTADARESGMRQQGPSLHRSDRNVNTICYRKSVVLCLAASSGPPRCTGESVPRASARGTGRRNEDGRPWRTILELCWHFLHNKYGFIARFCADLGEQVAVAALADTILPSPGMAPTTLSQMDKPLAARVLPVKNSPS
jgi:hypothetical protein